MSARSAQAMLSTALRLFHLREAQMGWPAVHVNAGDRFGHLVVIREQPPRLRNGKVRRLVECRCKCKRTKTVLLDSLRRGATVSCGCHKREVAITRSTKHGLCGDPAYNCWHGMLTRCTSPTAQNYRLYGGRGISVCSQWHSFQTFLSDMGPRPSPKHTIDRRDNDCDYTPENCRWATQKEQGRNTRSNRIIEYAGQSKCITEWSEVTGLSVKAIRYRLSSGWPVALALELPPHTNLRGYAARLKSAEERMRNGG